MSGETEPSSELRFKRVLLKISGEALMGPTEYGIHTPTCAELAQEVAAARELGVEICLVIGGVPLFGMIGGLMDVDGARYANYLLPWGIQNFLHHHSLPIAAAAVLGCLGYTAVFLYLGRRHFLRRDV